MKVLFLSFILLAVSGCSLIAPEVTEKVANGVEAYCKEPVAARQFYRVTVNDMTAPNVVVVSCEGDPDYENVKALTGG